MGETKRPNFRARLLARTLRRLREQNGYTQEEAARKLVFTDKKLSRIEQGQVPGYHEFLAMLDLYGIIVSDFDEYILMRERATEKGWWHAYGLDDRGFVSVEAEASEIRTYQLGFVPGLLQTEAYIRDTFAAARVPFEGRQLENEVAVRLRRQRRLVEDPLLTLHAVVDETTLHRQACDRGQLQQIIERASLPNITFQVIPHAVGTHDGLVSSFLVVSFPDVGERDLAYVEYGFGALQIENEHEARAARLMFNHLADVALDEQDSLALVEGVLNEH